MPAKEEDCNGGEAIADGNPNADVVDCTGGGDLADEGALEKLIPPKASDRPPNASCFVAIGGPIAPKDACRSCDGCGAG